MKRYFFVRPDPIVILAESEEEAWDGLEQWAGPLATGDWELSDVSDVCDDDDCP